MSPRKRHRKPAVIHLPAEFEAGPNYVVAIVKADEHHTLGIRFESPEHIAEFTSRLMDLAAQVWPDNPWVKIYLDEGEP